MAMSHGHVYGTAVYMFTDTVVYTARVPVFMTVHTAVYTVMFTNTVVYTAVSG